MVALLLSYRKVSMGCGQPKMGRQHAHLRQEIVIWQDKVAHFSIRDVAFPIFVRPSLKEWRIDDSPSHSLSGGAQPGAERLAVDAESRGTKERFIDHAKPRRDSADRVLLSYLSEISKAPQRRSAIRGLTASTKSKILPCRQNDLIRGPHEEAADDACIRIQFKLS